MALAHIPSAPTDSDFVMGEWFVKHRRLKEHLAGCGDWLEFGGRMSTRPILGGHGNLEDNILYFPDEEVRAIALRSYDPDKNTWSIWWLDGRFPDRMHIPVVGTFRDGIGTFFARDTHRDIPIIVKFTWRQLTRDELIWEQAFSADDGQSWETNWTMNFHRRMDESAEFPLSV